jgi:hypothetical protein
MGGGRSGIEMVQRNPRPHFPGGSEERTALRLLNLLLNTSLPLINSMQASEKAHKLWVKWLSCAQRSFWRGLGCRGISAAQTVSSRQNKSFSPNRECLCGFYSYFLHQMYFKMGLSSSFPIPV